MKQALIFKGWEGFADRLQCLSNAIEYCLRNDASITVDWRDRMWGQGRMDFSDYFEILGVEVLPLSQVVDRLRQGAAIEPKCWTPELLEAYPSEANHYTEFEMQFKNYAKIGSDIVVLNGKGIRTWHLSNLINCLKLRSEIVPMVTEKLSVLKLPYSVVHLRGTDRLTASLLPDTMTEFETLPPHTKARVYVISDTKDLVDAWMEKYPQAILFDSESHVLKLPSTKTATHFYDPEELSFYKVSKHELNINTLVDFLVVCFSNHTIGNKESLFLKMGKFIRTGGQGIAKWLDGFSPDRVQLT